jgi:hypothetical protein
MATPACITLLPQPAPHLAAARVGLQQVLQPRVQRRPHRGLLAQALAQEAQQLVEQVGAGSGGKRLQLAQRRLQGGGGRWREGSGASES